MTDEMMTLRGMVEKTPDADVLREMTGFNAERLVEMEVGGLTGAAYGEMSAERLAQRNGCRDLAESAGPVQWNCASRSCARGATSPTSSN